MTVQNKALRIGAIAAAVVGAVAIPATAFAATAGTGLPSFAATSAAIQAHANRTVDIDGQAGPGGRGGERAEAGLTKLAASLNVSVDALKEAMKAAREETKPATKPATKPDEATREAHQDAFLAAFAGKLGVSVDTLKAAMEASKPAAAAKPTTAEMKAMIQPRLAQMVTAGKLTQAQADQILADLDAGKPVFEILKQYMPQFGGGDHGQRPGGRGPGAGPRA